jgi:hypothetical protein
VKGNQSTLSFWLSVSVLANESAILIWANSKVHDLERQITDEEEADNGSERHQLDRVAENTLGFLPDSYLQLFTRLFTGK